ncbi:MAG: GNAT family N-acetyltransferase [Rhodospirillales bacterium]|nr:GNAT family N-acetyltransferase [Rhodospirillales bacterium]
MDFSIRNIQLKLATEDDFEFFRQLHHDTMKPLVTEYFGWDEEEQKEMQRKGFTLGRMQIIYADEIKVGCMQITNHENSIELEKIYISPECQGKGIGSSILNNLLTDASEQGKDVILSVLKNNKARDLYERLGFIVTGEAFYKYYMKYNK